MQSNCLDKDYITPKTSKILEQMKSFAHTNGSYRLFFKFVYINLQCLNIMTDSLEWIAIPVHENIKYTR